MDSSNSITSIFVPHLQTQFDQIRLETELNGSEADKQVMLDFANHVASSCGLNVITPDMKRKLEKLEALEACGVDNWQGYDEAMSSLKSSEEE